MIDAKLRMSGHALRPLSELPPPERSASANTPVQRLIDLGDAVTHPGMLRAKITSGPVVPGGIDHGVLAVGKAHGPGEWVGEQVTLDCQVLAILNQKPAQVRRGHDEDGPGLVADRAVDLPGAVRTAFRGFRPGLRSGFAEVQVVRARSTQNN